MTKKSQVTDGKSNSYAPGTGIALLKNRAGLNRLVWDLRYPGPTEVPGAVFRRGKPKGPLAVPGKYHVQLAKDGQTLSQEFEIIKDPRLKAAQQDFEAQFQLLIKIRDKISEIHHVVNEIRSIRGQLKSIKGLTHHKPYGPKIKNAAESIEEKLWPIEEAFIQFRAAVRRDLIALPVMLNDKLSSLAGFIETADGRPTKQDYELFADLSKRAKYPLEKFNHLVEKDLASFNHLIRELNIPAIILI